MIRNIKRGFKKIRKCKIKKYDTIVILME